MKQPTLESKQEYAEHELGAISIVVIPGTNKKLRMKELHPGTMKWLTRIWIERDVAAKKVESGTDVLKDLCVEPSFAFKEAAIMYLNHDIKLRLFYPFLWRWWSFRYTESQMLPIIAEGKKKVPLESHYTTIIFSKDMRTDVMKMTKAEAEQYQAELLSGLKQPS